MFKRGQEGVVSEKSLERIWRTFGTGGAHVVRFWDGPKMVLWKLFEIAIWETIMEGDIMLGPDDDDVMLAWMMMSCSLGTVVINIMIFRTFRQ